MNLKRKRLFLALVVAATLSTGLLPTTAAAVTPYVRIPEIPDISSSIHMPNPVISPNILQNATENSIPDETHASEPSAGVPQITSAAFAHSRYFWRRSSLKVQWTAMEDAQRYEVEIILANGDVTKYTSEKPELSLSPSRCPRTVVNPQSDNTGYARVRAVTNGQAGDWSDQAVIVCNVSHASK